MLRHRLKHVTFAAHPVPKDAKSWTGQPRAVVLMAEHQEHPPQPDPERLAQLLSALVAAEPPKVRRLLEIEAETLLHPTAEAVLRSAARTAASHDEDKAARGYESCADLLAACREHGVAAVFAQWLQEPRQLSLPRGMAEAWHELQTIVEDGTSERDCRRLKRQIALCEQMLAALPRRDHADLWPIIEGTLGNALKSLGNLTGDISVLRLAEQAYRAALLAFTRERTPMDWATTQTNLGNVLWSLGERAGDTSVLRQAAQAHRDAQEVWTRERAPIDWAITQTNLGNVLRTLGNLTGEGSVLRQAEQVYRDALKMTNRERTPMDWAVTQNALGAVLRSLGDLTGDASVLRQAERAYRAALLEFTRERAAMRWAATQTNLGIVLQSLGELTGNASVLRQAEQACLAALLEFTYERAPMDWATTQNNLGTVLQSLGDLTGDMVVLRHAEQAYRAALEVRTREHAALDWATTQTNLGSVLARLGDLTDDVSVLRQAEQVFRSVLEVSNRDRAPMDWAMTETNLGNVLGALGDLARDPAMLRQAEQAHRAALLEFTPECAAMRWAATQNNLGIGLQRLGDLTGDISVLRQAEQAHRAALLELTREPWARDWAMTQSNLGNVLQSLGDLTGNASLLRQAEQAYRGALSALDDIGAEGDCQGVASALARLLVRQNRYTDATTVTAAAIALSDAAIMDAGHGREARAAERVGDLYSMLSLCRLRQQPPDITAALVAAATGRARLLADALALDTVHLEDVNSPDARRRIDAARRHRTELRFRLGYERIGQEASLRHLPPADRARLQAEFRDVTKAYFALCRKHRLIHAPEPLELIAIMASVPKGGALVLPVLTESEAFAFVVANGAAEPVVIDLPLLDRGEVVSHLCGEDSWLTVCAKDVDQCGGKDATVRLAAPALRRGHLTTTLAWLWERLLGPVHQYLHDIARLAADSPVVLVAPGLLGLLPLQAAGPGPDGMHFGDYWTVSYATSVHALLTCRQRLEHRCHLPAKLLAVINPAGETPLLGAKLEAPMLLQRFAHAEPVILQDAAATLAAVLVHLPSASYFHASTHGSHDWREPTKSGLLLADGELILDMLHETKLGTARLVFLSACDRRRAGVGQLSGEFIGLPAGFVQAGAACVVANLWPIRDDAAFLLASRFYELHLDAHGHERKSPAVALREAQSWLRHATFGDLKQKFPVDEAPDGRFLLLSATSQFTSPADDAPEPARKAVSIRLPLGNDDDCPYADAEHWAAFTVTGT